MRHLAALAIALSLLPLPALADGTPLPHFGVALDAGVPSGAGLLLLAREGPFRLGAGPMWSGLGYGATGGLAFAPFAWAVSPVLEVDGGYCPKADLTRLAGHGAPLELRGVLSHSSYSYLGGLFGFDFGSPRGFSFFLRGGLARIEIRASRSATSSSSSGDGSTLTLGDATARAVIPAAKLGFQLWF
jgi:hypothetical protein